LAAHGKSGKVGRRFGAGVCLKTAPRAGGGVSHQPVKDSHLISEHERAAYLKLVHGPQNFFKHANDDPASKIFFRYKITPLLLLDAVVLLLALKEEITWPIKVFLMWIQLEFPDLLCHPPAEEYLREIRASCSSSDDFRLLGLHLLKNKEAA
jgi:hypothetical protein